MFTRRAWRVAWVLAGLVALASMVMGQGLMADTTRPDKTPSKMAPARDPALAVREEFLAARAIGTEAALELFIARHGDSPLAQEARDDLQRLKANKAR